MGMGMQDDFVSIILGLGDPMEPGMHGPLKQPCPTGDAVGLVTKIRDMCDEWLRSTGKCDDDGSTSQQVGDTGEGGDDGEE